MIMAISRIMANPHNLKIMANPHNLKIMAYPHNHDYGYCLKSSLLLDNPPPGGVLDDII